MWEKKRGARIYGYARVSTDDQDLALQIAALEREECDHIICEKASARTMDRPKFKLLMKVLRRGDRLVVWKLDRLGRTLSGLIEVVAQLGEAGVDLVVVTERIDTTTPTGKMIFHIMAALAQWERDMISDRTKAGMAVKKAEGVRFGRAHSIRDNPKRIKAARKLLNEGKLIAMNDELLISARDLMDILNKADPKAPAIDNPETVRRWWRNGFPGLDDEGGEG